MSQITVVTNVLKNHQELTRQNKEVFDAKGIFVVNLMSSPGSGKTSILEKLIAKLKEQVNIAVIEGDLYTTKDAQRIEAQGVPVVQINTGGACHLDGKMIKNALAGLNINEIDLLVIENVGNLVCPAGFDLGEDIKISVLSTTEGNDKPLKYPAMFEKSGAVILNKTDLLAYTNFNLEEFYQDIRSLNQKTELFEISCLTEHGIAELCQWLKNKICEKRNQQ